MPILGDCAQALEGGVGTSPSGQAGLDAGDDGGKVRKVLIVQAAATNQFPYPLDGIEFGAVGRQEMEAEMTGDPLPPRFMEIGVVIARIIADDDNLAVLARGEALEFAEELPAGSRIEHSLGLRHHQFSVGKTNRTKEADAFARRGVATNRIANLRRHPQAAARAVLLEMHLIHGP